MPNIRGGKGYKKSKSGRVKNRPEKKNEVVDVAAGEGFFAKVKNKLGGKPARIEVTLSNGTTNIVYVRGRMHKKVWINEGLIVLVNKDMEIIKVIKDSDENSKQAIYMLDKFNAGNVSYIDMYGSSSDNDNDDDSEDDSNDDNDNDSGNKLQKKPEISHSDSEDSLVNLNRNYDEKEGEDEDEDKEEERDEEEQQEYGEEEDYVQEEYYNNYKDNHYNKKNENKNKKSKFNIDDI